MRLSSNQYMVFIFPEQLEQYNNGESVVASTERFGDKDIPVFVEAHEYGQEYNSGTIVWIRKGGWI
jgi:hypothetical protein